MSCHSTHAGVAATRYAREVSGLDEAQVANLFHRLKRASRDGDLAGANTDAMSALQTVRMRVEHDLRLSDTSRTTILARLDKAVAAAETGNIPDQDTLHAMKSVALEADLAATELDNLVVAAAATQRCSVERMRGRFNKWRRDPDTFEDVTAPDPAFNLTDGPHTQFTPTDKATARALRKMGWENYLAQPLPVFMYGTLCEGQPNSHLINEATVTARNRGVAAGIGVYGPTWGFPYAQDDPAGTAVTVGEVVNLDGSWEATQVRTSLDHLEGFSSDHPSGNHYDRVARPIRVAGVQEPVAAWVYLMTPSRMRTLDAADLIPDGDWVAARKAARPVSRYSDWTDEDDPPRSSARRSASAFQRQTSEPAGWDDPDDMFAGMGEADIAARYRAGGY